MLRRAIVRGHAVSLRITLQSLAVIAWSLSAFAPRYADAQSPRIGFLDGVRGVVLQADCDRDYALKARPGTIRLIRRNVEAPITPVDTAVVDDRLARGHHPYGGRPVPARP